MKLTRPSRLFAACIMLFGMLFMQLAVAAYACPGLMTSGEMQQLETQPVMQMAAMDMNAAEMSGCTGADQVQPNLCHAHDHVGDQSSDKPNVPAVSSFIPTTLVVTLGTVDSVQPSHAPTAHSDSLTRTTAPPLSIQHCCFRI